MSKTIDERVISMQFDNKHFESNVKTSMSTLDKLKQKLNFKDGSKGLENLGTAAKNVNMNGLSSAVENVRAKFSALDVMAVTALANITNAAVNAGTRIVKSLTIDPVMDGFREYEMTLNAVQTTMSATGKTAEEVERELKKLDEYADKTVYSSADMLNNLPKFTNAGVELETATTAMIGIANATALAGGDASKASIAFYNLGQAIGTGYLTRMDYNSINNAGIATMEWKNQMVDAAIAAGTLKKKGDDLYEAGGKTFTLQQLFIDGLQKQWASTDVMLKVFGDYGDETTAIGKKAFSSAQDIKTFTMMMDSLKATAGTGWKDTWQTIFGGLDDAKVFWTGLSNFVSKIITTVADYRNYILDLAFNNPFTKIIDRIKEITNSTKDAVKNIQGLEEMARRVIRGDFGNQWDNGDRNYRAKLVEAEGFEYAAVQNLVNEKLGSSVRLTTKAAESQKELNKQTAAGVDELLELSDAELKKIGFTTEDIRLLRILQKEAKKSGKTVDELIADMDKMSGREHLLEGFKNVGQSLARVLKSIGAAWVEIFPPESTAIKLYNLMAGFHDLSEHLKVNDETADKLKRTFKGLFAAIDIILTVVGGPIKIAFKLLGQLLAAFDLNILDVTAGVGDAIVKFRDWLDSVLDFTEVFKWLAPHVTNAAVAIRDWFASLKDSAFLKSVVGHLKNAGIAAKNFFMNLKDSSALQTFWSYLKKTGGALADWFKGIKDAENIPKYIIQGLANGIRNGASLVWDAVTYLATSLVTKIKEVLGIHSPSTVFAAIGGFIIAGLVLGLVRGVPELEGTVQNIGTMLGDLFAGVDWGSIFAVVTSVMTLAMGSKLASAVKNLTEPLRGVGDVLSGVGEVLGSTAKVMSKSAGAIKKVIKNFAKVVNSFSKVLNATAFNIQTEGIKNLAVALLMIVGAIAIITLLDPKEAWNAVGIIAAIAVILTGMAFALSKMDSASAEIGKGGAKLSGLKPSLLQIGAAILLMAFTVKLLGSMDPEQAKQGFLGLVGIVLAISALCAAYGTFVKGKAAQNIDKAGKAISKIAGAMLLLVILAKLIAGMEWGDMGKAAAGLLGLVGIIALLTLITTIGGKNIEKTGKALLKISAAMLILVVLAKIIAGMSWGDIGKAAAGLLGLVGVIALLVLITKLAGPNIDKLGATLLAISGSVAILAIVAKILAGMSWDDMGKAAVGLLGLVGVVALLILIVKMVKNDAPKIAATLLAISGSIAILALTAALLSLLKPAALAKGILAMAAVAAIAAAMVYITKFAGGNDLKGTMIGIAVAIGVMAASIAVLSFLDPAGVALGTACIAALVGMLALVMKASGSANGALGTLIVIAATIAVIGTILIVLAANDTASKNALPATAALSTLLLALAGVLVILDKTNVNLMNAVKGAAGMLLLCVPLLALVGILALMQNVKNAEANAKALALLSAVLSLLLIPLCAVGVIYAATGGMAALGIVGLLGMCVPLLALVGILALMQNIKKAEESTKLLVGLMTAITAMTVILAIVGPLALIGVAAATAVVGLITAVGLIVTGIGALMTAFPQLEKFVDKGIGLLIKLADGIGQMIGAFIGGVATKIAESLPAIGLALSQFITNAMPFIVGIKMADEKVLAGVGIIAAAILALTLADFINSIVSFMSFGSSFADLGTELSKFMINAKPFLEASSGIDPAIMDGVKTLAEALMIICGANLLDTITGWLGGSSSLDSFGEQIGKFGGSLNKFVTSLGTFDDSKVATVECACDAIKALASAADEIPATDGLWQKIAGEKSLAAFGEGLAGVGTNIASFVKNLGTFDDSKVATVDCAGKAITTLANAANEIPATEGLWQKIVGDKSLASFSEALPGLGTNMASFAENLGSFDADKIATIDSACGAIKSLAAVANDTKTTAWEDFIGTDSPLVQLSENLPKIGKGLNSLVAEIDGISDDKILAFETALRGVKLVMDLGLTSRSGDLEKAASNLQSLKTNMKYFGQTYKEFVENISVGSQSSLEAALGYLNKLLDSFSSIPYEKFDSATNAITGFQDALMKLAKRGIDAFTLEFKSADVTKKLQSGASSMASGLVSAMNTAFTTGENTPASKMKSLVSDIASSIKSEQMSKAYESAGAFVVQGFANGIKNNKKLATDAGSSLGKAALAAAKESLDEHSPSKEMYKVGDYAGQGFVNALYDYADKAYDSGSEMAESARSGLSKAIAKVTDIINADIDAQPTIRPVLDLSDVRSGTAAIGSMLSGRRTLSVDTRTARAVAASMSGYQNGGNSDVVSAIKGLRKDVSGLHGDTYNFGDFTYSGDSEVADAVQTLVRAIRIGGRS